MPRRFELYSPLPPEECLRRIGESLQGWRPRNFKIAWDNVPALVRGSIDGSKFWIYKNSVLSVLAQPWIEAAVEPHENGSRIFGRIIEAPFVKWFAVLWCAGTLLAALVGPLKRVDRAYGVPLMMLAGLAFAALSQYLARDEPAFLANFLHHTLLADGERDAKR